jgi:fluoride exporter
MSFVWVALGGAIGSVARYGVNIFAANMYGTKFPWGTLCVNVLGCFAMGLFTFLLFGKFSDSQNLRLFLTTGVLGGFTTFSAFSLDFVTLVQRSGILVAATYALATVVLSFGAVVIGFLAARVFAL